MSHLSEQHRKQGLNETKQVLESCVIAREKLEIGDYDAGCLVLLPWWTIGGWPNHSGLSPLAAAELLLLTGSLTEAVARTKRINGGQRQAEVLISGAVALFEHLDKTDRALEARIELGCCY